MSLTSIKRQYSDCGHPIIKLEGKFECFDPISGKDYASGLFAYKAKQKIKGYIKRLPLNIERTVSENCRTQKVKSAPQYQIQGAELYPEWKMAEIENLFHASKILVDGHEVIFRGGAVFEAVGKGCPAMFKLNVTVEECTKNVYYGCAEEVCDRRKTVGFVIDNIEITPDYYDTREVMIASTYEGLKSWYSGQRGVEQVYDLPTYEMNCEVQNAFAVVGIDIPEVFYAGKPSPATKVYGMEFQNVNDLCRGIDNTLCSAVVLGIPVVSEMVCSEVVLGVPTIYSFGCDATPVWTGTSSIGTVSGEIKMLMVAVNREIADVSRNVSYFNFVNDTPDALCVVETGYSPTISLVSITRNGVPYGDYSVDADNNVTLVDCLAPGDIVEFKFVNLASPSMKDEVIATISGQCIPSRRQIMTNSDYPQIPPGASIDINTDGVVRYSGPPTSIVGTAMHIDMDHIYYTLN